MTKILLTRHGHVEGIHPARFRGRAELPLTELGLAQSAALARRIAAHWKPVAVYTSPRERCVVTGAKIAAACGIAASVHEGLGDIDYGAWQMRTHEEVKAETPVAYQLWRESPHLVRFPEGESLQDVVAVFARHYPQVPPPRHAPARAGDIIHSLGRPDRARTELGFSAQVSVADGLAVLIRAGAA